MNHRYVITGGPGAGKTTILGDLAERGYSFAPESARSIIKERLSAGLSRRPDPVSFAQEILRADIKKYQETNSRGDIIFFDRGILDALYMLNLQRSLTNGEIARYVNEFPYNKTVFLLPPWKEIYDTDRERDQTFEESIEIFEGMKGWYLKWGYNALEVPRDTINKRRSYMLKIVENDTTRL